MAFKIGLANGKELTCGDEVHYQFLENGVLRISSTQTLHFFAPGTWREVVALDVTHTPD